MADRPAIKGDQPSFSPPLNEFLRWVPDLYIHSDGSISPGAFSNTSGTERMSVNWAALSSVQDTLAGRENCGVVSITSEFCMDLYQEIERTPTKDNAAHCDVVGHKPTSVKRKLAQAAKWLYRP